MIKIETYNLFYLLNFEETEAIELSMSHYFIQFVHRSCASRGCVVRTIGTFIDQNVFIPTFQLYSSYT